MVLCLSREACAWPLLTARGEGCRVPSALATGFPVLWIQGVLWWFVFPGRCTDCGGQMVREGGGLS